MPAIGNPSMVSPPLFSWAKGAADDGAGIKHWLDVLLRTRCRRGESCDSADQDVSTMHIKILPVVRTEFGPLERPGDRRECAARRSYP
jgi:hypothetical protein